LSRISLKQIFIPNWFGMKKMLISLLVSFPVITFSQNVGIGSKPFRMLITYEE